MKYRVGIDLGGTNIATGIADENGKIVGRGTLPTRVPRPAEHLIDDMIQTVRMAAQQAGLTLEELDEVGIGTPGSVDPDSGVLRYANNLGYTNLSLKAMLEEGLPGKVIHINNDANVAAYGEALFGAAKGKRNVILLTLGTGVGGGIVINGKIYAGLKGYGAELGHAVMVVNGRACTCGRLGCVEAYCSVTGLIAFSREKMQECPDSFMWELAKGSLENVDGRTSFDAMKMGDTAGKQVIDMYTTYLGIAVASYVNIFAPEILLIGGGISREGEILLGPVRTIMEKEVYSYDSIEGTKLAAAKLGNDAGIIGAAFAGSSL